MHRSVSTAQSIGTKYGADGSGATAGGMCLSACKERGGSAPEADRLLAVDSQAPVAHDDAVVLANKHILRLNVVVEDAHAVCMYHPVAGLYDVVQLLL